MADPSLTDITVPINTPDAFGAPEVSSTGTMTVIDSIATAPQTDPSRSRPGVRRHLQGDGANVILMNFAPGQRLDDHQAAHPITVQCAQGRLLFTCGDEVVEMRPVVVLHLTSHLTHRVDCPADAPEKNVLILTMLTGERHQ